MSPKPNPPMAEVDWLTFVDIRGILEAPSPISPWFPAYLSEDAEQSGEYMHSALVPLAAIPELLEDVSWDISIGGGVPGTIGYSDGKGGFEEKYFSHGNNNGIEPLLIHRDFHGMRSDFVEVSQEFTLFHNLFHEPSKKRYLHFDEDGNESIVARYDDKHFELKTSFVLNYCAAKKMALALYIQGHRQSELPLDSMFENEIHEHAMEGAFTCCWGVTAGGLDLNGKFQTSSSLLGKRYFVPSNQGGQSKREKSYLEFIIGAEDAGSSIKFTCDPKQLSNYFGKNPGAPHFLTPVYFRPEVLAKYYAAPQKYSVEDGHLRCGGLWILKMDNDHQDCVMVFLGYLGQTLSENEQAYWLSFNFPPDGRKMSKTTYRRGFLAEFTDPSQPDLVLKHQYGRFNRAFRDSYGWNFFLPLHDDDEHTLVSLRTLASDSQAEFDSQLIALTKVLVDSLNEKQIAKELATLEEGNKGITKLEKFFSERGLDAFDSHIKFLRVLQDLRSKSAAHRKGSSYEKLIRELQMDDDGQQKVFAELLKAGCELLQYLRESLTQADWADELARMK